MNKKTEKILIGLGLGLLGIIGVVKFVKAYKKGIEELEMTKKKISLECFMWQLDTILILI